MSDPYAEDITESDLGYGNGPDMDGPEDVQAQRRRDRHQPEYAVPSRPFPDDFRGVEVSKPIPEERGRVLR